MADRNLMQCLGLQFGSKIASVVVICHGDDSQFLVVVVIKKGVCIDLYFQKEISGVHHTEI